MQRIIRILTVLALLALGLPAQSGGRAQGNTYYVDPAGSDPSGDGTSAYPWQSVIYGVTQLAAGDTLLINPGIYQGGVYLNISGTPADPITIHASGPGVVIEGSGVERDAFFIEYADYVIVDGLTIQHATRAGLRLSYANHVTIRNSTFAYNGTWGIFTDFSDYTLVEDSESHHAGAEHGIYISNSSDYPTIRRNRLHDNYGCGLHMNGDISMGGDGIISHGLVEGNIVYGNGAGGGSGINMDGVTDTIVRNNLLYDNHASGISLYQIDGGSGSQNNRVLNNTILMPADGRWAINIDTTNSTGNQVLNNILYSDHTFRGSISIAEPGQAGFESDYNIVVDRLSADTGDTQLSLAEWQALGYDAHSLIAVPDGLFVNPAARDYHLKPGSAAIDRGMALSDVANDLEGNPRPAYSGYDIGAYELTPALTLWAIGGNQSIRLSWKTNASLPDGVTWRITYGSPPGIPPSPVTGIPLDTSSYLLTGLANSTWYTLTLDAMQAGSSILTATASAMPTDNLLFLPVLVK